MQEKIIQAIQAICSDVFNVQVDPVLSRPDEQFGDYACNVALQLSKELNKNPREIGQKIADALIDSDIEGVESVSVAGPGFINMTLTDSALAADGLIISPTRSGEGQELLIEFGNFNALKAVHLGHLYSTIVSSSIQKLLSRSGAKVHPISYHGDVGMHVAKAIWAIGQDINWDASKLATDDGGTLSLKTNLGTFYKQGNTAFESDPAAAEQIREVNRQVYVRDNEAVNKIHEICVQLSFELFEVIYGELGVTFERHYWESETADPGEKVVKNNIGSVFEKSDGAIVYKGEKDGLHTRVFINSEGLPTYEAKDLGLIELKKRDYPNITKSIIITGNEQQEYFKVMLAALKHIHPEQAAQTEHITHGFLSLTTGKMSSRTGNVFGAQSLMDATRVEVNKNFPNSDVQHNVYIAALKYTFLKSRIGGDIVFDVAESVSLDGNSGPYIQYAYARARSILRKCEAAPVSSIDALEAGERTLVRKLSQYEDALDKATNERMPHNICAYLYELAQEFNRFYEKNRVIGNEREAVRIAIVSAYSEVLKDGLDTLGIPAPEKM